MKKANGYEVTVYELGIEDFMVDIVEMEDQFESWLYRDSIGRKTYVHGWYKDGVRTKEMFIDVIKNDFVVHCAEYDRFTEMIEKMYDEVDGDL